MDEETKQEIFQQVQRCMISLVGGSGHMASYEILLDKFNITKIEELQSMTCPQ